MLAIPRLDLRGSELKVPPSDSDEWPFPDFFKVNLRDGGHGQPQE